MNPRTATAAEAEGCTGAELPPPQAIRMTAVQHHHCLITSLSLNEG
jgi:hypothetical protein